MVTSTLRFSEYVVFDRTVDKQQSIFEFFVTPDLEDVFLDLVEKLAEQKVILSIEKLPNRLMYDEYL